MGSHLQCCEKNMSNLENSGDISKRLNDIFLKNGQGTAETEGTSLTDSSDLQIPAPISRQKKESPLTKELEEQFKKKEDKTEKDKEKEGYKVPEVEEEEEVNEEKEEEEVDKEKEEETNKDLKNMGSTLLPVPWRDFGQSPWCEETKNQLKNEIVTHELTERANIEHINVLLVGEIGAGKSSFFNNVESLFDGHVTSRANSGAVEKSLTTQYRQYFVSNGEAKDRKQQNIKFRFCDSMGLEGGTSGLKSTDMGKIMDGHVENLAELSGGSFLPGSPGYNSYPTDNDRVHCVVTVMNSETATSMDDEVVQKLKDIRKEADGRHLFPLIILTNIDKLCPDCEKNASNVFNSEIIRDKVNEVSDLFGIKANQIHPVRNYNSQTECLLEMDILTLRALRQILRYSKTYLKDLLERQDEKNKQLDAKIAERENKRWPGKTLANSVNSSTLNKSDSKEVGGSIAEKEQAKKDTISDNTTTTKWKAKLYSGAPGQISLKEGELVEEVSPSVDGWMTVRNTDGKEGPVPTSHLNSTTLKWKAKFYSGAPGQLSLIDGEFVEEMKPAVDGWMIVRNSTGKEGPVPTSHLTNESATAATTKWKAKQYFGAPGQMSLTEAEVVEEVKPAVNGWMTVRKRNGEEGLVPSSHLMLESTVNTKWKAKLYIGAPGQISLAEEEIVEELKPAVNGWMTIRKMNGEEGLAPTSHLVQESARIATQKWKAKPYSGAPGQMSLMDQEVVEEVKPAVDGWMTVKKHNGEEGLVPTSHLMKQSDSTILPKWKAKLYSGAPGHISLADEEIVEEAKPAVDGWMTIRKRNGEEGLVPTSYLTQGSVSVISEKKMRTVKEQFDSSISYPGIPGFLNIGVGEILEEVNPDDGAGWTELRSAKGEAGMVPTDCLEPI